ncbi:hypothetical protein GCM10007082_29360 [Oceanisphaera arctica]|nr:hypothetical protein GCM10007082_29360 [Oceanisphaera arctica]
MPVSRSPKVKAKAKKRNNLPPGGQTMAPEVNAGFDTERRPENGNNSHFPLFACQYSLFTKNPGKRLALAAAFQYF